jgi:predicted  nucleic acid-binding Zn-ribbon protein
MTQKLSALEKGIRKAEREFVRVTHSTARALERDARKLSNQINRLNRSVQSNRNRLAREAERLTSAKTAVAKRKIRA